MDRSHQWLRKWGGFVAGVCIGLIIVTPVLAAPPDLPVTFDADAYQMLLLGSGALLAFALALKVVSAQAKPYRQAFFPEDRRVALEDV